MPPKQKPSKKQESGQQSEPDFKSKYAECNKELQKASKQVKQLTNERDRHFYDLCVIRNNFDYEKVRILLPSSMDNDGLQAEENARLTNEITKLMKQQVAQLNGTGSDEVKATDESATERVSELGRMVNELQEQLRVSKEKTILLEKKENQITALTDQANKITELEKRNAELEGMLKERLNHVEEQRPQKDGNDGSMKVKNRDMNILQDEMKTKDTQITNLKRELQDEMKTKDNEIGRLDTEIDRLNRELQDERNRSEMQRQNDASADVNTDQKTQSIQKEELQKDNGSKDLELARLTRDLEDEKMKSKRDMSELQNVIKTKETEIARLKCNLEEEIKKYERNKSEMQRQNGASADVNTDQKPQSSQKEELQKENEIKDRELARLRHDLEEEIKKGERETISLRDEIKRQKDELTNVKQTLATERAKYNSLNDEKRQQSGHSKEKEDKLRGEVSKLKRDVEEANAKHRSLANDVSNLTEQLEKANTSLKNRNNMSGDSMINELHEENEKLKTRLSQMAGAQLMSNNPNIADLSDVNRPTKIAEQYTELYDNEWTNAFEVLENAGMTENESINTLYRLILDVYKFCTELSNKQSKYLKLLVISVDEFKDGHTKESLSDDKIAPTKLRQLKELRKAFAPDMIDSVFQRYIKENPPKLMDKQDMKDYVHKCITLCWFMNVQDPPVVLDTNKQTGSFNTDIFKTYTKTGKSYDFIVWAPLYLHEGGPMLSKGVAQGK